MKPGKKLFHHWSSGKDAALALHKLLQNNDYNPQLLVTTVAMPENRISMHGIRRGLLEAQLKNTGFPFHVIEMPEMADMETYQSAMHTHLSQFRKQGFSHAGFGDILLEDVKAYREAQVRQSGMEAVFPLWQRNTREVLEEFLEAGFKAIIVSCDANLLDKSFCGKILDRQLINDLPDNIDVCGENGEFHTFCFDGPLFKKPVLFRIDGKEYKEYPAPKTKEEKDLKLMTGYWFCDLIS